MFSEQLLPIDTSTAPSAASFAALSAALSTPLSASFSVSPACQLPGPGKIVTPILLASGYQPTIHASFKGRLHQLQL